jgi:hypothetical protein
MEGLLFVLVDDLFVCAVGWCCLCCVVQGWSLRLIHLLSEMMKREKESGY